MSNQFEAKKARSQSDHDPHEHDALRNGVQDHTASAASKDSGSPPEQNDGTAMPGFAQHAHAGTTGTGSGQISPQTHNAERSSEQGNSAAD